MKNYSIFVTLSLVFCLSCKKEINAEIKTPALPETSPWSSNKKALPWNVNINSAGYMDYFCKSQEGC